MYPLGFRMVNFLWRRTCQLTKQLTFVSNAEIVRFVSRFFGKRSCLKPSYRFVATEQLVVAATATG